MTTMSILFLLPVTLAQAPDQDSARDTKEVRQTIDDVLSNPEFRRLKRDKEEDEKDEEPAWVKWLSEKLDSWFGNRSSSGTIDTGISVIQIFVYALVFLAILVVIGLIVRAAIGVANSGRNAGLNLPGNETDNIVVSTPPGESPSAEYERRAIEMAKNGDYKAAIRQLVLGCMSWIERAGRIRYRRGLTNRDYLRAIWRQTERRDSMTVIVQAFELVYFGRRVADSERFDLCLQNFQGAFRDEVK